MGTCMTCGNEYENTFTIIKNEEEYDFDCFECAIQALAPRCGHCDCAIIGQGVESEKQFFCGNHCLRSSKGAQTIIEIERFAHY